jgi:Carboxypeptidase regulatory-like domain
MTSWWLMAIGLAACGSAQPAPIAAGASDSEPWAADCATKETFVEAGDSALEGVLVDCMTGEKIPGVNVIATGTPDTAVRREATSDASGRYRLQLPEGRYRVAILEYLDNPEIEIEIRAQHTTVKEMRLDFPRCPPARGGSAEASQTDIDALIAAVLDHHAAAGIIDAPRRSDPGPTYVTIQGLRTLALPPNIARQYIVTTKDDLRREVTRSGRKIRFISIRDLKIGGSCATVIAGGDLVVPPPGVGLGCSETEVFLRRGGRWAFRVSGDRICT